MLVSAHQPAYLPWPGLLDKIRRADVFVIADTVQLTRKDWTVRNRIKTQNGVQMLTVPVKGPRDQRICDVQIDDTKDWRRKHWRAIELAYGGAPHWPQAAESVRAAIYFQRNLALTAEYGMRWLCREFDIDTTIVKASQLYGVNGHARNEMIVAICQALNADEYLFGEMGRAYFDKNVFLKAGVKTRFQQYRPKPYPQLHGEFVPGLSAVDMLLNCGPDARRYL